MDGRPQQARQKCWSRGTTNGSDPLAGLDGMGIDCRPEGMRVLLTKKLAQVIDGVDLTSHEVGEVFEVSAEEARLLVAEHWAIVERRVHATTESVPCPP